MGVDVLWLQGSVAVSKEPGNLEQPRQSMDSPVVVPEGHRQHAWHDGLHAGESAGAVLGCCLVHDHDVEPVTLQPPHHFHQVIGQIDMPEGTGDAVAPPDVREATRVRGCGQETEAGGGFMVRVQDSVVVHGDDQ